MTKKRRAKAGEIRASNYDVIVYAPGNWLYPYRITVRDKDTRRVVEAKSYVVSWGVARAVKKLIVENRSGFTYTLTHDAPKRRANQPAPTISAVDGFQVTFSDGTVSPITPTGN